jgi:hypothetical protein
MGNLQEYIDNINKRIGLEDMDSKKPYNIFDLSMGYISIVKRNHQGTIHLNVFKEGKKYREYQFFVETNGCFEFFKKRNTRFYLTYDSGLLFLLTLQLDDWNPQQNTLLILDTSKVFNLNYLT